MYKGIIALDLDGTLLNSNKELTDRSRVALARAAGAGWAIVPTTGRFFGAMPEVIRSLPFLRYAITINGAQVEDRLTGEILYRAELDWEQAVEIMAFLDEYPVIYDCYQGNEAFMSAAQKEHIDELVSSPHYRKMVHALRQPVPELKALLRERKEGVQKIQFFTNRPELRRELLELLPRRFEGLAVSSSVPDNVEINQKKANKGEALLALSAHLGLGRADTLAFGDGLNDLSMLSAAGRGYAMANACPEAMAAAHEIIPSCDDDGVAQILERICFPKEG